MTARFRKILRISTVLFIVIGLSLIALRWAERNITCFYERIVQDIPDNLWCHGANGPEKFLAVAPYYSGVEIDLIYHEKEQAFECAHDAVSLEENRLEKTLEAYRKLGKKMNFWLDLRGMTRENAQVQMQALDAVLKKYGVEKSQCLLEVRNPDVELLRIAKEYGYRTGYSFWCKEKMTDAEWAELRKKTHSIATSGYADAFCLEMCRYDIVKKLELPKEMPLMLWDIRRLPFFLNSPYGKRMMADPQTEVILVLSRSRYDR